MPRCDVMRHMIRGGNIGLITDRQVNGDFMHILCSKSIIDNCATSLATRERSYLFPLYSTLTQTKKARFSMLASLVMLLVDRSCQLTIQYSNSSTPRREYSLSLASRSRRSLLLPGESASITTPGAERSLPSGWKAVANCLFLMWVLSEKLSDEGKRVHKCSWPLLLLGNCRNLSKSPKTETPQAAWGAT